TIVFVLDRCKGCAMQHENRHDYPWGDADTDIDGIGSKSTQSQDSSGTTDTCIARSSSVQQTECEGISTESTEASWNASDYSNSDSESCADDKVTISVSFCDANGSVFADQSTLGAHAVHWSVVASVNAHDDDGFNNATVAQERANRTDYPWGDPNTEIPGVEFVPSRERYRYDVDLDLDSAETQAKSVRRHSVVAVSDTDLRRAGAASGSPVLTPTPVPTMLQAPQDFRYMRAFAGMHMFTHRDAWPT
ncbi:MAG: hypothetical protein MHM6MM_006664, partial [Cercozoa sp. M6MM]